MDQPTAELVARAREALEREGLLLVQDARFPSLASLAAGGPIAGSWWGHAAGRTIYRALETLVRDADAVDVALVDGKRTLVHRGLVPALLALASANAPWQTAGLDESAQRLLAVVRRRGTVRLDELQGLAPGRDASEVARLLESRLLAHGGDVHTESGAHVRTLEHWERVVESVGASPPWPEVAAARARFEAIASRWQREHGAKPRFPWDPAPVRAAAPRAERARAKTDSKARDVRASATGSTRKDAGRKGAPKRAGRQGAAPKAASRSTRGSKAKRANGSKAAKGRASAATRTSRPTTSASGSGRAGAGARRGAKTKPSGAAAGTSRVRGTRDDGHGRRRPSRKRRGAAG